MQLIEINQIEKTPSGVNIVKYTDMDIQHVGILPTAKLGAAGMQKMFNRFGVEARPETFYGFWIDQNKNDLYAVSSHSDSVLKYDHFELTDDQKKQVTDGNFQCIYNKNYVKVNISWGSNSPQDKYKDTKPCLWIMNGGGSLTSETLQLINKVADKLCRCVYKINDAPTEANVTLSDDADWLPGNDNEDSQSVVACDLIYKPVAFIEKYESNLSTKYVDQPEP